MADATVVENDVVEVAQRTPKQIAWGRFKRNKVGVVAGYSSIFFITEKIFKPIRHAQPFVVFGTVNTLATLRSLGYQTFDTLLDNSYDSEINNTERYIKTLNTIKQMNQTSLHEFYVSCKEQLLHNQELFLASKYPRLQMLDQKLNHD